MKWRRSLSASQAKYLLPLSLSLSSIYIERVIQLSTKVNYEYIKLKLTLISPKNTVNLRSAAFISSTKAMSSASSEGGGTGRVGGSGLVYGRSPEGSQF
jgi:hypothetical protein